MATAAKKRSGRADFIGEKFSSKGREGIESECAAEIDDGEPFVGRGDGAAQAGFEEPALGTDEVGGEQGLLLKSGAGEVGALLGLGDGLGADGKAFDSVVMRETCLLDLEADAESGFAEHFLHLRELGVGLADLAGGLAAIEEVEVNRDAGDPAVAAVTELPAAVVLVTGEGVHG